MDLALTYYKAIDVLEAQETLAFQDAVAWPHAKEDYRVDRNKILRQRAFPRSFGADGEEKPLTTAELGERLNRVLRGR